MISQQDVEKRRIAPRMVQQIVVAVQLRLNMSRSRPLSLSKSKYLENQIFVACENHSVIYVQYDSNLYMTFDNLIHKKIRHTNSMADYIKFSQQRVL